MANVDDSFQRTEGDLTVDFVAACKCILKQVDKAESLASGRVHRPARTLAMTVPIVFGRLHVVPVENEVLARFAQINVHLTLSDHTIDIVDEHIDLAARQHARRPAPYGRKSYPAKGKDRG